MLMLTCGMNSGYESTIDSLNNALIEAYGNDTDLFAELTGVQKELGLLYGERPTCPFLRPHFLSRQLYDSIVSAAEHIAAAAERVTSAALEDEQLLDRLGLSEIEKELAVLDHGYSVTSVSSRFDTFVDGSEFKFLEYNAETPAGVGDQMQLEIVLNRIPLIKEFLENNEHWMPKPHKLLLRALFDSYRERGGKKSKPNIAIVDWEGVSTEAEFHSLKDYFESAGFQTLIADPSELEYDGKSLAAGSFEIDIVYKRVLIHEFLEKFGISHPLVDAYRDQNICLANSFRTKIPHKKSLFEILSDDSLAHLFSREQLSAIRHHIPWTRRISEGKTVYRGEEKDLFEFIRNNRERLILKPNDDYGGQGIFLGWETAESEWDDALNATLGDTFVIQERAPIRKEAFPMFGNTAQLETLLVDFDPFLFRNKVEGGMVRLSAASLVNVTQGGGQTALAVLE